jgi:hypothetical protein
MNNNNLELGNSLAKWLLVEGNRIFKSNGDKDIWIDGQLVCENGEILK